MIATLDDVAPVARRFGRLDDVETDIEVGWADRPRQLHGTARSLAFDERCPKRALLARHYSPDAYVHAIAATYRSEQEGVRSPVFDCRIRDELARVVLPDTIANRERAKVEYFKARADLPLDVAPRWPLVDPTATPLTRSVPTDEERAPFAPATPQVTTGAEPAADDAKTALADNAPKIRSENPLASVGGSTSFEPMAAALNRIGAVRWTRPSVHCRSPRSRCKRRSWSPTRRKPGPRVRQTAPGP